ncbi:hypothetical protein [Sphingobacterium rhinopitheci]|uniref:hypothetical protein n=1 Tax=Sphingobacterium rhinopitheci TaxID=2781960 RepID=UPI001F516B19|nr:hypothetical protein [Sphingobacterium rhinopitheci]MCI0919768.1 hypothetical protein [Sphingobacterium rhinopitheci]
MISITQYNLDKIEDLLDQIGYKVRYEKGNFRTGACVIQNTKVIVVNKFSNLEIKINSLVLILKDFEVNKEDLDEKQWAFYKTLTKSNE